MSNGVPAALQNAMNGPQDSKPFTYLPGGLDFSEIRSPRMAKRLAKHQVFSGPPNGYGNMDQKVSKVCSGSVVPNHSIGNHKCWSPQKKQSVYFEVLTSSPFSRMYAWLCGRK